MAAQVAIRRQTDDQSLVENNIDASSCDAEIRAAETGKHRISFASTGIRIFFIIETALTKQRTLRKFY